MAFHAAERGLNRLPGKASARGMCAITAGEGKSALFCTEFSEEFGDAPNSVTNSALIFSQCRKKHIFQ